jgi:hypothetical protein
VEKFSSEHTDEDAVENPLEGVAIPLDEELFRCEGELSMLESSHLAQAAISGGAVGDAAEAAGIAFALKQAFGPAEYERFRQHCREHDTPPRVVIAVLGAINEAISESVEARTGRPTGPPRASSPGPTGQGDRTSRIASLGHTGTVQLVPPPAPGTGFPEPLHPAEGQEVPDWSAPPGLAGKQPATVRVRSTGGAAKPRRRSRAG